MADLQFQPVAGDVWLAADQSLEAMVAALQDDLNTPTALAILSAFATEAEDHLISTAEVEHFRDLLTALDELFGLSLANRHDIADDQKALIAEREQARQAKDWAKSDELRTKLTGQNIAVRDTPHGPIWHRL